jgi:hypothetical protein
VDAGAVAVTDTPVAAGKVAAVEEIEAEGGRETRAGVEILGGNVFGI